MDVRGLRNVWNLESNDDREKKNASQCYCSRQFENLVQKEKFDEVWTSHIYTDQPWFHSLTHNYTLYILNSNYEHNERSVNV